MRLNKIFTLLMIIFPILYIYHSGILTLSVADVVLILLIPFLLFDMISKKKKIKISNVMFLITALILLQLVFYLIFDISSLAAAMTTIRIILYYSTCSLFVKEYFDYELGIKYLKRVTFIAALFWIIQYVLFNFFGVFLQGTLPFFKTEVDTYNTIMNTHSWTSYAYARPRSFFSEPSHFAVYEALGLIIFLFKYDSRDKIPIVIVILAMFLSGSGMAMTLSLIVMFIYAMKSAKNLTKRKLAGFLLVFVACLILYPNYSKTNAFQTFYNRTFVEKDSTNGRFDNFISAFSKEKKMYEFIIGEGMYKIEDVEGQEYITSVPRVYTYFGLTGFILFCIVVGTSFFKLKSLRKYIFIILFAICFSSEIIFHNLVMVYLPFILKEYNDEKK